MRIAGLTLGSNVGRQMFGVATLATGLITLAWHSSSGQLRYVIFAAAVAQILGGVAILFRRSIKTGAVVLGVAYLVLALLYVPRIVSGPLVYDHWGNFFEQFSLATGAAIVYARLSSSSVARTLGRIGRVLFGLCVVSFALEQAFYLSATASFVPKYFPPSQMFWAQATTVAFAIAAVALFANRMALLATRLLTAMLLLFGIIVWIPALLSDSHTQANWSETAETFAIAGAAWILADFLRAYQANRRGLT